MTSTRLSVNFFANDNLGGFKRSTQHLLAVYLQASGNLMSLWDVDSGVAIFGRAALERCGTGRFLLGSIVSAVDWCFRSCRAARDFADRRLSEKQRPGAAALLEDSQRQRTIGTAVIRSFSRMQNAAGMAQRQFRCERF